MSEVSQTQALERQLEENKVLKARKEAAERLWRNRDFKLLIVEGFMLTDCARFAQVSGDDTLKPEDRADALSFAQASGHLKRWLELQAMMGATSDRNIADIERALAEVRAEEGAE